MHRNEAENMTNEGLFPTSPPYAVITAEFVNSLQEELMNIINQAGLATLGQANDTRDQVWNAIRTIAQGYDYIVDSQTTFVNLFERQAANQYKIKDDYYTVLFKYIPNGYSFSNVLSNGDTWGDIFTNNCVHIHFQNGTFINFANYKGHIRVETDDCLLENVWIKGTASVAAGITESFKLDAYRVTFDNCKCSNRLSNVDMAGFQGSITTLHNLTSKYINCAVFDLDGSDKIFGFNTCYNISNSVVYQLDSSSGADHCYGFRSCYLVSSCPVHDLNTGSGNCYGFYLCHQVSSCYADSITSSSGSAVGFYGSEQSSSCYASSITSSSGAAIGFDYCYQISASHSNGITSSSANAIGFNTCSQMSSCKTQDIETSTGIAYGFYNCGRITACYVNDVDTLAGANNAYGFYNCVEISASYATNITSFGGTAYGYHTCSYGSSIYTTEALNANNDWIDSNDAQITNQYSCPAVWT